MNSNPVSLKNRILILTWAVAVLTAVAIALGATDGRLWIAAKPVKEHPDSLKAYGRELIAHTARFLGPEGSVAQISNGMNCQNCHLDAGTKEFGNNYRAVAANYPKYRARSGTIENIYRRINDCFERSLNGKVLDTGSREMQAIAAYILSVGQGIPAKTTPKGSGIYKLAYLDRAVDPVKGKLVYDAKCITCHGADGQGVKSGPEYSFPPLWGKNSYNSAAGLYRMSNLAGYVYANMPQGATHSAPQLTEEQAWDVAAFINSQDRPSIDISKDWPKIAEKPVDHPFGPFADSFSENQHKYGPFGPIAAVRKKQAKN